MAYDKVEQIRGHKRLTMVKARRIKTTSRSCNCNNSHQGVQLLITTPQAINNNYNINQNSPLRIVHPSLTPISLELQCCLPTYMTMPPATTPANQSSHSSMTMAQLQKELVHAMADRFEADVNISIFKAQIMAEEARLRRGSWSCNNKKRMIKCILIYYISYHISKEAREPPQTLQMI